MILVLFYFYLLFYLFLFINLDFSVLKNQKTFNNLIETIPEMRIAWQKKLEELALQQTEREIDILTNSPKERYLKTWSREIWPILIKTIPIVVLVVALIFYSPFWIPLLAIFVSPFIVLIFYPAISGEMYFFKGLSRGLSYGGKDWGNTFLAFLMMLALCYFFTWAYHNPIAQDFDFKSAVLDLIVEWHTITVFDNYFNFFNEFFTFCNTSD